MFQGCCGYRHLLVLLALVPQKPVVAGRGRRGKQPLLWEPHRLYQESNQPGVEAAGSWEWLTHTSQMLWLGGTPLEVGV